MIGVKNNGHEVFTGRFNGEDFDFEPGVTVALSEDAARHIFGWGNDDKSAVLSRNGWATTSGDHKNALKHLDQFQFLGVKGVEFEGDAEAEEQTAPETLKMAAAGAASEKIQIPEFTNSGKKK